MNKKYFNSRNMRGLLILLVLVQFGFLVFPHLSQGNPNDNTNNDTTANNGKLTLHQSLKDQLSQKEQEAARRYPPLKSNQRVPPANIAAKDQLAWTREFYGITRNGKIAVDFGWKKNRDVYLLEGHCDLESNYCGEKYKDGFKRVYKGGRVENVAVGDFFGTGQDLRARVYRELIGGDKISTSKIKVDLEKLQSNNQWRVVSRFEYWTNGDAYMAIPVGADVDGDGVDELVLLKYNPHVENTLDILVINYSPRGVASTTGWRFVKILDWQYEVLRLSVCSNMRTFVKEKEFYSCKDERAKFYGEARRMDWDNDGYDEIVLRAMYGVPWNERYYHWQTISLILEVDNGGPLYPTYPAGNSFIDFQIVDYDNDKRDEIVWYEARARYFNIWDKGLPLKVFKAPCAPPFFIKDTNRDGKLELFCKGSLTNTNSPLKVFSFPEMKLITERRVDIDVRYFWPKDFYRPMDKLFVGDFDADYNYEVLEIRGSMIIKYDLFNSQVCPKSNGDDDFKSSLKGKKCELGKVEIGETATYPLIDFFDRYERGEGGTCPDKNPRCFLRKDVSKMGYFVMGNFKGRIELEHVKTEYKTMDVTPLLILAAPPYKAGISQNYDDTTTTFGKSKSKSESSSRTYGYSVDASVTIGTSFKTQALFTTVAEFEVGLKIIGGGGQDFSKGQTHAVILEKTYETGTQDSIIFLWGYGIRSTYEIVKHPDPLKIGTEVYYWKPLETAEFMSQVDYFDANFPQYNVRSILKHKVGDPTTYMKKTDPNFPKDNPNTIKDNVFMTPMSTVAQGTGTQSLGITLSEEFTDEKSWNAYVGAGFAGRVQAGVIFVETEITGQANFAGSVTTAHGKDLTYSGTVGAIEDKFEFENYNYKYGLIVYMDTLKNAITKQKVSVEVVNYYVEIPATYGKLTDPRAAQGTAAATGAVATGTAAAGKKQKCC